MSDHRIDTKIVKYRVVKPGGSIVHLVERSESGDELRLWDIAWRSRVESTGFQHAPLQPSPGCSTLGGGGCLGLVGLVVPTALLGS